MLRPICLPACWFVLALPGCKSLPDAKPAPLAASVVESSAGYFVVRARTRRSGVLVVSAKAEPHQPNRHGEVMTDAGPPGTVLTDLRITLDESDVSPPRSETLGFTDPNLGPIDPFDICEDAKGQLYVILTGGDGGSAHARRFVIDGSGWIRTEYRDYRSGAYLPFPRSE